MWCGFADMGDGKETVMRNMFVLGCALVLAGGLFLSAGCGDGGAPGEGKATGKMLTDEEYIECSGALMAAGRMYMKDLKADAANAEKISEAFDKKMAAIHKKFGVQKADLEVYQESINNSEDTERIRKVAMGILNRSNQTEKK